MSDLLFVSPPLPHYITCGEDTYMMNQTHPNRHNIGVFDLIIVTEGTLFMTEESFNWAVHAGQVVILRPDRHHYSMKPCDGKTHFYWLHFHTTGEWSETNEDLQSSPNHKGNPFAKIDHFYIRLPRFCVLITPLEVYAKCKRLLSLNNQPSNESRWQEQQIFQEILQNLNHFQKPHSDNAVQKIAENAALFLRQNYLKPFNYKTMGDELHFHPTYIARCMKQVYGCTPLDYVNRFRIEQSKLLLLNTDLPVHQVAAETGFSSATYYIRCFTNSQAITPRAYRQQFRT